MLVVCKIIVLKFFREFVSIMTIIHVIGVNASKTGPEISYPTKRQDTQVNLFDINGTLA